MHKKYITCIMLVFLLYCFFPIGASHAADLKIWFLGGNGTKGTGTLIQGPNGRVVLFDEGYTADWASYAKDLMDAVGISYIDYAVAGHYDSDHIGALDDLNNRMGGSSSSGYAPNFGVFYDRGGNVKIDGGPIDSSYFNLVDKSGKRATVHVDGSSDIDLGNSAVLRFLSVGAPNTEKALYVRGRPNLTSRITENNKSISALVTYGGFDLYLGSDLEGSGEKAVDDVVADLGREVDVLLVDHHGSRTYQISSPEFLANMNPEVAVISVWNNSHGHPTRTTVENLQDVVEQDSQRIIRLQPGDEGADTWAPEDMAYCYTTNTHLYVVTNGSSYTVDTVDGFGGNDITNPSLVNHATDQPSFIPTPVPTAPPPPALLSIAPAETTAEGGTPISVSWTFQSIPQIIDAYFGVELPDQRLMVMDPSGVFQSEIVPITTDFNVSGNPSGNLILDVPYGIEPDTYVFKAVSVPAGTSVLDPANWITGRISTAEVSIR
jgi:competence protein ComEC